MSKRPAHSFIPVAGHTFRSALLFLFASLLGAMGETVQFSSANYIAAEGYTGNLIVVSRTGSTSAAARVEMVFRDETAIAGADFLLTNVVTFSEGEADAVLLLTVPADTSVEGAETATLELAHPSHGLDLGEPKAARLTLHDRSVMVRAASDATGYSEFMASPVRWTLTRTGNPEIPFAIGFETQDISARAGDDFVATRGRVDFPAGALVATIEVPLINDALTEAREAFRLILTNATPWVDVRVTSASRTIFIDDDDKGYSLCCYPSTVDEDDEVVWFIVQRIGSYDFSSTVDYVALPVTAEAATDFVPTSGTVEFGPGESEKEISVPLVNDAIREAAQTFDVVLTNASHGLPIQGAQSRARVSIVDNDVGFRFAARAVTVSEAADVVVLQVLRATDAAATMSVEYQVVEGTAVAGTDFSPVSGTLTFQPGEIMRELRIPLLDDGAREPDETFSVVLTNPGPGTALGPANRATVTILSDDTGFEFDDAATIQTAEEAGEVQLTVRRAAGIRGELRVDYGTLPGSATPGEDYAPVTGTLVFGDSDSTRVIRIPILNDSIREASENFRVILSKPGDGTFLGVAHTRSVSIAASDQGFSFPAGGRIDVWEGFTEVQIAVDRGSDVPGDLAVDFRVNPGTATPGEDYQAVAGTLNFGPGDTQKFITVPLLKDGRPEDSEDFRVELLNPGPGALLGARISTQVVIADNDLGLGFSSGGTALGFEAQGGVDVAVMLFTDSPPDAPVSVDFATVPVTATPGVDYEAVAGTLTFAPGETSKLIHIPLLDDAIADPQEEFTVRLSHPVGLPLHGSASSEVRIVDDEWGYRVLGAGGEVGRMTVLEGKRGISLRIVREGDFNVPSTVDYLASRTGPSDKPAGTATPGEDYVSVSGTLTFAPGETGMEITLPLLDDTTLEPAETLWIWLSHPTGGVPIAEPALQVVLQDNEHGPLHVDSGFELTVPHARWLEFPSSTWAELPVLPLPDGRILMTTWLGSLNGEDGLAVVRLLANGQLDPTFAPAPISLSPKDQTMPGSGPRNVRIAPQSDGGVWVGGPPEFLVHGRVAHHVARLKPDGSLDTTWTPRLLGRPAVARLVAMRDGSLLLGLEDSDLVRLRSDGSVDGAFRGLGWGGLGSLAVDGVGRVLVGGGGSLTGFLPDGAHDERWNSINAGFSSIQDFFVQSDDSVIVRYASFPPGQTWWPAVGRATPSGKPDPTFSLAAPAGAQSQAFVTPWPGGKLLAGWGMADGSTWVTRHHPDGGQDHDFSMGSYEVEVQTDVWGASFPVAAVEASGDLLLYGNGLRILSANGHSSLGVTRLQLDMPTPRVEVAARSAQVRETNGLVTLTLLRTGDSAAPIDVRWETRDGAAVAGRDYEPGAGVLHFGVGVSQATLGIRMFDNADPDRDRSFHLTFTTAEGRSLPEGTVTIVNDDLGFPPGGMRTFPNGRVLLKLTGARVRNALTVQRSHDLREWEYLPDVGAPWHLGFGVFDRDASTAAPWFYRLVGED